MEQPLYVAFVWHMHQPYYRDKDRADLILPWVRLHATKDYLHMAEVLEEHPNVHVTFNLAPSLVEQLLLYVDGEVSDKCLSVSIKEEWSRADKEFMLSFFFSINWDRVLRRHPPYARLLDIRSRALGTAQYLSDGYYRDLATWFNLAWIDPNWLEREPALVRLVNQGAGYSVDDTRAVIEAQRDIMARILDLYRMLEERGQAELTTSPYFHPILPLITDSRVALEASPGLQLPDIPFEHPEDAVAQLRQAIELHQGIFGRRPRGMWPPEGAVSQAVLALVGGEGMSWIASDEDVLAKSLGKPFERDTRGLVNAPHELYRPYRTQICGEGCDDTRAGPSVLFRDHLLSDRIGFVYKHMDGQEAADDFVSRLLRIRDTWNDDERPPLVPIILDGENPWEEYEHSGDPFLHHLYQLIAEDPNLHAVTVREYLERYPPRDLLPPLTAGSWISGNLETWIGEETQNRAWDQLSRTRQRLSDWQSRHPEAPAELLEEAWKEVYIAEGSDWFWWYSSRNVSNEEEIFDRMFRERLARVHELIGEPIPGWLPAEGEVSEPERLDSLPSGFISPELDPGAVPHPRWAKAGLCVSSSSTGAMQKGSALVRQLYYGYDPENLYLRLEANGDLSEHTVHVFLAGANPDLSTAYPEFDSGLLQVNAGPFQFEAVAEESLVVIRRVRPGGVWEVVPASPRGISQAESRYVGRVCEIRIPFEPVGLRIGDRAEIWLVLSKRGMAVEALPAGGTLGLALSPHG